MLASDLGLAGLLVPEALGGAGASMREAAVVLEELGRAVAPVPYLGSAVVATTALLVAGATGAARRAGRGSDRRRARDAVHRDRAAYTVKAEGDRLSGTVTSVADALPADVAARARPRPGCSRSTWRMPQ